ncbi:hypothetical protein [Butyricicoccus sp.]|uniref:hypothetical protein n=1 Tax=Butyricicoccus sp. TaxID=2049021 RepID=UPI003D7E8B40
MKRLIFIGDHIKQAAKILFAEDDRYTPQMAARWPELEVTVHHDGRYAVWVNLMDDAELLQDTIHDHKQLVQQIAGFADEVIED